MARLDPATRAARAAARENGYSQRMADNVARQVASATPDTLRSWAAGQNPIYRAAARTQLGAPVATRRTTANERIARDYAAYRDERYNSAERATRGNMLNPAGRRLGVNPDQWFNGRNASTRYASEELKDWLRANGPTLSATEYRQQIADPPRASNPFLARTSNS